MTQASCPLCSSQGNEFYRLEKKKRFFYSCSNCSLIFQSRETCLSEEDEKARYEQHENTLENAGYRQWLESFIQDAFLPWYKEGNILDFGSGPSPALTELLKEQSYPVFSYDPYFSPVWPADHPYHMFLVCEVLEHIKDPLKEFRKLYDQAAEDGILSLKTQFLPNFERESFRGWWYKEDPTHICFYSPRSLKVLGELSGWNLIFHDQKSLAIYKKTTSPEGSRKS